MRALVIDDDKGLARLLSLLLVEQGFAVDVSSTGVEGRTAGLVNEYDIVVLDLELPDCSGGSVLHTLRQNGREMPVLVLTATDDAAAMVTLLDAGADDYIVKPVENAVFRARVRALMRRRDQRTSDVLAAGPLVIDLKSQEARVAGQLMDLRAQEYRLLSYLVTHAQEVVTRTDLLEKLWDMHFDPGSNVVDVAVARLRRKLREYPGAPSLEAVRGRGYVLRVATDA